MRLPDPSIKLGVPAALLAAGLLAGFILPVAAQQSDTNVPLVVQPGAPGQSTRVLPPYTRAILPPISRKDVEFMQGMIHHHAQAVEMVALMHSRTTNKELLLLGARISHSQADEIRFMELWLAARAEPTTLPMPKMPGMDHGHMDIDMSGHLMLMPGMLAPKQMDALRKASGNAFDRLFLEGMIQHHGGALVMVKGLVDTAGAAQDAVIFNFITDIDSGQRAEIRIMQAMLENKR